MRGDTDRARSALAGRGNEHSAAQAAAMIAWWNQYWSTHQQTYQVSGRNPVRCNTAPSPPADVITCH